MSSGRRPGFLLFTDLPKAGPYLSAIREQGLVGLVLTAPPQWPMERIAMSYLDTPGHAFASIEELGFVGSDSPDLILAQVADWLEQYEIVGTFSSSEVFVESAARVADWLRLPGAGLRAAQICRNKHLQRRYLSQWSPISVLAGCNTQDRVLSRLKDCFPLIVKPLTMYCSIGVRTLADEAELNHHIAELAAPTLVLVEERVVGREFSVESIVLDGDTIFSSVTEKQTNEAGGEVFVEMAHTVPAIEITETQRSVLLAAQAEILSEIEFGTGMVHGEYRLGADDSVVLIEIAARPPGDGLMALYHLATGSSMEATAVRAALGQQVCHPPPQRWARQIYFEHEVGQLRDVRCSLAGATPRWLTDEGLWPTATPAEPDEPAGLRQLLVLKDRDAELGQIVDSFGRAVTAIFDAPSIQSLESLESTLRTSVDIRCR